MGIWGPEKPARDGCHETYATELAALFSVFIRCSFEIIQVEYSCIAHAVVDSLVQQRVMTFATPPLTFCMT